MNLLQGLAREIVALKMRSDNMESDFEPEASARWYEYALSKGMVELLFYKDILTGFIETVRTREVPKDFMNVVPDETGSIAYVVNIVAQNLKDLLKLKTRAIAQHMDCTTFVWYRDRYQKPMVHQNIRRKHALPL